MALLTMPSLIFSATELLTVFLISLVTIIYIYYRYCFTYWQRKNVPSLPATFPVGNLGVSPFGYKSVFFQIKDLYDQFKAKGSTFAGIYFFNGPIYFPIDTEMVKSVLVTDFDKFVDRGMYIDEEKVPLTFHIFAMKGEQWRNIRMKLTPVFTSGKMKAMFNILVKNMENLVVDLNERSGTVLDIKKKLTRVTTDIIGSVAFGIDCNSLKNPDTEFVRKVDKIFTHSGWQLLRVAIEEGLQNPGNILKISHRSKEIEKFFTDLVRDTIEYRDKNNVVREDFLNILMQMRHTVGISFKEIVAQSFLFFTAGFETSSSTMSFCLHELSFYPEIQDRLRKEIHDTIGKDVSKYTYDGILKLPYLDKVIKETLRKYPPVPMLNRISVKPYQIPGTDITIDPDTPVIIPVLGLHRDPDHFPEPLKFDPERFDEDNNKIVPFSYLPFGDGPRNCIGLRFGNMQTKIGVAALVANFKFTPADTTPYEIPVDCSTTVIVFNVKGGLYTKVERI